MNKYDRLVLSGGLIVIALAALILGQTEIASSAAGAIAGVLVPRK